MPLSLYWWVFNSIVLLTNLNGHFVIIIGWQQHMNYFKSVVKNVYVSMVEDDYLEPLVEHDVVSVLHKMRRRMSSHGKDPRKMSIGEPETDLVDRIEMLGHVSPDREFRIMGADPRYQIITGRVKELNEDLSEVSGIMMENFPKYEKKLTQAIKQIDNIKSVYLARKYSMELQVKLKRLEEANRKSKRITQLNIRLKNIKSTLKILTGLPNIHKMSLIELKSINTSAFNSREAIGKLTCLQGIDSFIDRIVSSQLAKVLVTLETCLTLKFQEQLYENALKNFLVAQHESLKYEKLLVKMVEKEIRKYDNNDIYQICLFYVRLMINLHGVFKWHREHEHQEAWKSISEELSHISIHINIPKVTKAISEIMDECLKETVLQKIHYCEWPQILQMLYYLTRISKITESFSGKHFGDTFLAISEHFGQKLQKLREKARNQLKETLYLEEQNQWNRLPVSNDFSYATIDKLLYQITQHRKLPNFSKITARLPMSRKILSERMNQKLTTQEGEGKRNRLRSMSFYHDELQKYLSAVSTSGEEDNEGEEANDLEEDEFEIYAVSLPFVEKFERNKDEVKLVLPQSQWYPPEVVICQSSLTLLKYFQILVSYAFYYPIPPCSNLAIDIMFYLLHYYIYHVLNCFISSHSKTIIFQPYEQMHKIEAKYHKKRIHYQFPHIYEFIHKFKKDNKLLQRESKQNEDPQTKQEKEMLVRCRVVACESINYLCKYVQHIFNLCGWKDTPNRKEQLTQVLLISNELSEILYTDCISRISNLKATSTLLATIKWADDEANVKEFTQVLISKFKDFFYQMKAQNKGEVPLQVSERLMGVYWKSQITIILKTFFGSFKPTRSNSASSPKNRFEIFIDELYSGLIPIIKNEAHLLTFYEKVKAVFPILNEADWSVAFQMLKTTILKFEFIFDVEMGLMKSSESCCYLSAAQVDKKQATIEDWMRNNPLKDLKGQGIADL